MDTLVLLSCICTICKKKPKNKTKKTQFATSHQPLQLPQNKHFYFFPNKPTKEATQSGFLCTLNTFTPLSTPAEPWGSSLVHSYATTSSGRQVCLFFFFFSSFFSFQRATARDVSVWIWRQCRGFFDVRPGTCRILHTVHLALLRPRQTLSHQGDDNNA